MDKEKEIPAETTGKDSNDSMDLVIGLYDHSDYDLITLHKSEEVNLSLLTKAIIKLYCSGKKATFLLPKIKDPFAPGEVVHRRYTFMVRFYPGRDEECVKVLNSISFNKRVGFVKNLVRASILGGFNDFYFDTPELSDRHHQFATSPAVPVLDYGRIIKGKISSRSGKQLESLSLISEEMAVSNPDAALINEADQMIKEDRHAMEILTQTADNKKRKKRVKNQSVPKKDSYDPVNEPVPDIKDTDDEIVDIFADLEKGKKKPDENKRNKQTEDDVQDLGALFFGLTEEY